MSEPSPRTAARSPDFDHFESERPNDTGSIVLRRAANSVQTIARLVGNSVLQGVDDEPVVLSLDAQSGLLDALELIAYAMQYEAELVDDNAQAGTRRHGFPDE